MKSTKSHNEMTTRRFKLLSDENRRRVLQLLIGGSQSVSQIAHELNIERTLLSHNLKALKDEGLVQADRHGKEVHYSIADGIAKDSKGEYLDLDCCEIRFK